MRRLTVRRSGKRRYINVGVGLRSISHSRGLGSIVVLRLRAVLGGIISFVIFAALIILFVRMHAVIFSAHSGGTRISVRSGSCQHEVSVLIEISARHARTGIRAVLSGCTGRCLCAVPRGRKPHNGGKRKLSVLIRTACSRALRTVRLLCGRYRAAQLGRNSAAGQLYSRLLGICGYRLSQLRRSGITIVLIGCAGAKNYLRECSIRTYGRRKRLAVEAADYGGVDLLARHLVPAGFDERQTVSVELEIHRKSERADIAAGIVVLAARYLGGNEA